VRNSQDNLVKWWISSESLKNNGRSVTLKACISFVKLLLLLFICNCSWVDAQWQQYSTHLQTNSTHNTENRTYITITIKKIWEVKAVPHPCKLYLGIGLTTEEKAQINLRVVKTSG
jgi:hypothetical protein